MANVDYCEGHQRGCMLQTHVGEVSTPVITTTKCEDEEPAILPGRGVGFDVNLTEASFAWDPRSSEPVLKDINLQIDSGEVTALSKHNRVW